VLCVSQFTLLASTIKGTKPDFHAAMPPSLSAPFYQSFLTSMRAAYLPERILDGKFGAMMSVGLCNEGPVTICLDSRKWEYVDRLEVGKAKAKEAGSSSSTPAAGGKAKAKTTLANRAEGEGIAAVASAAAAQPVPPDTDSALAALTATTLGVALPSKAGAGLPE